MRTAKPGDVRKQEFLDAALVLFLKRGYDGTTVSDIIHALGVSKGAFYHYFVSKEDVLKEITAQMARPLLDMVVQVAAEPGKDAIEKLNSIASRSYEYRAARNDAQAHVADARVRSEVARLRALADEVIIDLASAPVAQIISQGVSEAVFHTPCASEAALVYLRLSSIFRERFLSIVSRIASNPERVREEAMTLAGFYADLLERLLGMKSGSIRLLDTIQRYLESLQYDTVNGGDTRE